MLLYKLTGWGNVMSVVEVDTVTVVAGSIATLTNVKSIHMDSNVC